MAEKKSRQHPFRRWLGQLFRQPPQNLYGQAALYLSGSYLEIEQFKRILCYEEGMLRLELGRGILTVYGCPLCILSLSAHRITLRGAISRTEFSAAGC